MIWMYYKKSGLDNLTLTDHIDENNKQGKSARHFPYKPTLQSQKFIKSTKNRNCGEP